jgi:hypothetical protein
LTDPPTGVCSSGLKTTDALFVSGCIAGTKGHRIQFAPKSQVTVNGLFLFKVSLSSAAYRAFPIIRYIFPLGAGGYATVRITLFWIINIPADRTYIPVHSNPPFVYGFVFIKGAKSKLAIFFVKFDTQILLYCSLARFKSIFLLLYFNQSISTKWPKHFFAGTAYRAFPIVRQVIKLGPLGDFSFAISSVRIINISAINGLALIHFMRLGHLSSLLFNRLEGDEARMLEAKNKSPLQASKPASFHASFSKLIL